MKVFRNTLISTVGLFSFWQIMVSWLQIPNYLLPSPHDVFLVYTHQYALLISHAIPTLLEIIAGALFGIALGLIGGITIALVHPLSRWCKPLLIMSQAIPTFAIAPLIVMWLGYGLSAKIVIITLMIFFPVTSALYDGLISTPVGWQDLADVIGASKFKQFIHIRLPAALPAAASGIRIAAVSAPLGALIGEWVGSDSGLGYLMISANGAMQIDVMFAAVFILITLTLGLYYLVDKLLKKWVWWPSFG